MAIERVSPQENAKEYVRTPGWSELFRDTHAGMVFRNAEEADLHAIAAANIMEAIVPGLKAVGTLLWTAGLNAEAPLASNELVRVGQFIESLAELVHTLSTTEVSTARAAAYLRCGRTCFGERPTAQGEVVREQLRQEA